MIPDVVNITEAKVHDRYGLKQLIFSKDTIIVEDRAYFDFELILNRIKAENVFVTRIKSNTLYETIEELELADDVDQNILKDEIIQLTSGRAIETGISEHKLRLVNVYKEDENKLTITGRFHIVTLALPAYTPMIAIESNTPKISYILIDIFGDTERIKTISDLR
jgi:hypothetical protein